MTGGNSGPRSLADDLRARTDDELAALLRVRPDLVVPVPVDISQLASRAATRASVIRALDRLDQFALHVVDALVIASDPTTPAVVSRLLGISEGVVRGPLAGLRERALVWGTEYDIHLVRAVSEIIGPHPAGLGPPASQLLMALPPARLASIVADLGLPAVDDHAQRAEAVASCLSSPDSLEPLLSELAPEAMAALRALAAGPPTGRVEGARRDVDRAGARTPIEQLLACGLFVPVDDDSVVLPREVGLYMREGVVSTTVRTTPPEPETTARDTERVDQAAAASAFDIVRKVETLLDTWALSPPAVLRTGGLGVRDFRPLPAALDTDQAGAALVVELAHLAGMLASSTGDDEVWLPTPEYDAWQRADAATRWVTLVQRWLESSRVAGLIGARDDRGRLIPPLGGDIDRPVAPEIRREVLDVLAGLPAGAAPTQHDMIETVRWRRPRRGGRLRDELVGWTLREAEMLGVTGVGALASYVRPLLSEAVVDANANASTNSATEDAAAALAGLFPELLDHVLLQADLTAVAPGPLRSDIARELALVSNVESRGGASVHRFTMESVRRGMDAGRTAEDIHDFLAAISRTPVPQPLTYLVNDVARRHGLLRVGAAESFVRCDDQAVLAEILAAPQTSALGLRRIAPTVLVSMLDGATLLERLRRMGFSPTPESSDGSVAVTRAEPRRTLRRPAVQPASTERPVATEAVLVAAVRALRAGERSAAARPPDAAPGQLGRSASTQTLTELRRALDDGSTIWIGYVDHHGSTSERVVDPVRLEGGWLAAYDHRSSEIRSFAVHRISGVAPAEA